MTQVVAYTDHDLVGCAHLTAGLLELAQQGEAQVHWRLRRRKEPRAVAPTTIALEVTGAGRTTVRHAFDFHDINTAWDIEMLGWSDLYWKSNYSAQALDSLPAHQRQKVRPYGLYYPTRSRHDRRVYWRLLGSAASRLAYRRQTSGRVRPQDLKAATTLRLQRYTSRLYIDEYECTNVERRYAIYFHPGCWPMDSSTGRAVNQTRQQVIRRLRSSFGERFNGGFVPNRPAREHFPDDLYPRQTSHREYVDNLHSAHVVISTNGLDGCHSWRTAEALAGGAILVTEQPVNMVDDDFRPGENVFYYSTPEECEAVCLQILQADPPTLRALHAATQDYYRAHLAPAESLRRRLAVS
jgi:hypothetical protein